MRLGQPLILLLVCSCGIASCGETQPDAQTSESQRSTTSTTRAAGSDARQGPGAATAGTTPSSQPSHASETDLSRLYGTWVATDVGTPIGDVKIELVLREEGSLKILAWSELPMVGQVRNKRAPYDVQGNTISSEALRGGTSATYRLEGEQLVLTMSDGRVVRFTRKS